MFSQAVVFDRSPPLKIRSPKIFNFRLLSAGKYFQLFNYSSICMLSSISRYCSVYNIFHLHTRRLYSTSPVISNNPRYSKVLSCLHFRESSKAAKNQNPFNMSSRCSSDLKSGVTSVYGGDTGLNDASILYPPIEPFATGMLPVSSVHSIFYEQSGNPKGLPIVYVHGGPGGGIDARDRRYFDPTAYHAVLFDQRGAGKSTPAFCLEENDTWSLVEDMEKLRKHLGIERWVLFGGSWGSTLSLAYAEKHPDRVIALVLRGIFTLRAKEIRWFYQEGASNIFPDAWEGYLAPIPEEERSDMVSAYHKRLTGPNEEERLQCARAWSLWEMATSQLRVNPQNLARADDDKFALAFARIECHYFMNKGFLKTEEQLIDEAVILEQKGIPVTIVQGRYDVVCPATTAWDLYKKIPSADFYFVEDAGHSAKEVGITKCLVDACDKYKSLKP